MYFIKKNNDEKKNNNFLDDVQGFLSDSFFSNKALKTDIIENDNEYILHVEVPGISKENINLDFNNQYLTISVNNNTDKEEKNHNYIKKERSSYSYTRSYYLDKADESKIKAKLENGVLNIEIGKCSDACKKTIKID